MRVLTINFSPLALLSLLTFASWTDVSNQTVGGVGEEACEVCNKTCTGQELITWSVQLLYIRETAYLTDQFIFILKLPQILPWESY